MSPKLWDKSKLKITIVLSQLNRPPASRSYPTLVCFVRISEPHSAQAEGEKRNPGSPGLVWVSAKLRSIQGQGLVPVTVKSGGSEQERA